MKDIHGSNLRSPMRPAKLPISGAYGHQVRLGLDLSRAQWAEMLGS